jgi:hypothetical protein
MLLGDFHSAEFARRKGSKNKRRKMILGDAKKGAKIGAGIGGGLGAINGAIAGSMMSQGGIKQKIGYGALGALGGTGAGALGGAIKGGSIGGIVGAVRKRER